MPEPPVVLYESVPNHLIGPTSNFVLPQEDMSVAALAGFKLVSFPSLTVTVCGCAVSFGHGYIFD